MSFNLKYLNYQETIYSSDKQQTMCQLKQKFQLAIIIVVYYLKCYFL